MTLRKVRLTPRAELALRSIASWTDERFGATQAARYLGDLRQKLGEIASGTAAAFDCSGLVKNAPKGYRFTRSGQHFIVFVDRVHEVVILDFLHQRMDLPGKIAAILRSPKSR